MTRKNLIAALIGLILLLVAAFPVCAQSEEATDTENFFTVYNYCKQGADNLFNQKSDYLTENLNPLTDTGWLELKEKTRLFGKLTCSAVVSKFVPAGYETHEMALCESAFDFMISSELLILAIENGGNEALVKMAEERYARALDTYSKIPQPQQ